ncbi:MAG: M20/M25/M40 family metallo-hydrolase [Kordiimonadaceae bacterium]|nr:M20/M25/M40 family metallo-hydrolase [Kordiimonadaceae bacterium]
MPDTHEIAAIFQKYIAVRRDLHAHPELAFKEQRTAKIVEDHLRTLGMEVYTGLAGTGVVGVLDFGPGPFIGIRADMDALPITEQTGVPYTSETTGVMHACGHDGHTSMLLAAAEILAGSTGLSGSWPSSFSPPRKTKAARV